MIQKFVETFYRRQIELADYFRSGHPEDYLDIVKAVIDILGEGNYDDPDPNRIHEINDGDYQGTLVYIIAANGYQPSDYWYTMVDYGSCSGCDTLQAIQDYSLKLPTEQQVSDYMTLALHIVQQLRKMYD